MTGPAHYEYAERLLAAIEANELPAGTTEAMAAVARAHAALAAVAIQVEAMALSGTLPAWAAHRWLNTIGLTPDEILDYEKAR